MANVNLDLQSQFSLAGKVALVTGGSRGIGQMISQGLLQAGAGAYTDGAIIPVDGGTSINHQHVRRD